ncbi:hypothetical protein BGW38_000191 [Lunasporangiospora selenospora]|uniref:TauD/TfdA-like domain-containing protein n=1 Tax=Lunasporangiospora selenospora TaxID=979761 RepID=A0A9P6FXG1_9FUNG|nr:hypothetical protein BGW38_000191 [Lunasporangiospora selenospora]
MASNVVENGIIVSASEQDATLADRNTFATRVAGKGADPEKKALFASVTKRIDYTPKFGTELHGINLTKLTEQQSEELAALIAERGVVFFRDQDDLNNDEHVKLGRRWGPLHIHPLVPHNQNNPEIIVLDSRVSPPTRFNTNDSWHSDVSFEPAPASFSILKFEDIPESGGDTIWSNGYELYDDLSPAFKTFLEGLTAIHSSDIFKTLTAFTGRKTFGKLNDSEHPVVRTNPVTGWKSIYSNPVFTREIVGVTPSESKAILDYLADIVAKKLQYQVRFSWQKNSVAIWDNRSTFHTGVPDFRPYHRRGIRVTVSGEKPYFDANSGSQAKAWEATSNAIIAKQEAAERLKAEAQANTSAKTA